MGRLIVISGPSCVGKGPLHAALKRYHPDLVGPLRTVVLYNSREPRPIEREGVDYYFRSREEIEALRGRDGFVVMDVRGDLQALDLNQMAEDLQENDLFFEGNPFMALEILGSPPAADSEVLSVFISPLSRGEIEEIRAAGDIDLRKLVTAVMREKLMVRTRKQKGGVSEGDLAEIARRSESAFRELQLAHHFGAVIPNHDGEGSPNWSEFGHPLADARTTVNAMAALLKGNRSEAAEKWEEHLLTGS